MAGKGKGSSKPCLEHITQQLQPLDDPDLEKDLLRCLLQCLTRAHNKKVSIPKELRRLPKQDRATKIKEFRDKAKKEQVNVDVEVAKQVRDAVSLGGGATMRRLNKGEIDLLIVDSGMPDEAARILSAADRDAAAVRLDGLSEAVNNSLNFSCSIVGVSKQLKGLNTASIQDLAKVVSVIKQKKIAQNKLESKKTSDAKDHNVAPLKPNVNEQTREVKAVTKKRDCPDQLEVKALLLKRRCDGQMAFDPEERAKKKPVESSMDFISI